MPLSNPRTIFGVHSVTAVRRSDLTPYGYARVVQGSTFSLEGDTIDLFGGSNKFAWAVEDGDINAELAFSVSEYPNWLFEVFGGKAPTQGATEATGNVTAITNVFGTSVMSPTTGITASLTPVAADLKTGIYVLKAVDANTLDVFSYSDVDFGRGTNVGEFADDSLKIATIDITTAGVIPIPDFGLSVTGGSGTIAFVAGDTATFEVRAPNTFNRIVSVGGIADSFPEWRGIIYAQKSGQGTVFEIMAYRLKAIGLGLGAERKAFGQNEYTAKASYDSVQNAVCRIREVGAV